MGFSRKSIHSCLLLIFIIINVTASFSVEELCARRCLYGRGGILCNCNARHFTGKRSHLMSNQNIYITEPNHIEPHGLSPQDNDRIETSLDVENILGGASPQLNALHSHTSNSGGLNQYFTDSWYRNQFEKILENLRQKTNSNLIETSDEDDDNAANTQKKDNAEFPILLMVENDDNDTDDFDVAQGTKEGVASKVKQTINIPYLNIDQALDPVVDTDDMEDDNDEEPDNDYVRQHLDHLQKILRRALHRS